MTKTCFVLSCKSGYKTDQTKISLFKAPSNKIQFKKWLDVSRRKPPKIMGDIFFCANHFHETDIISFQLRNVSNLIKLFHWRCGDLNLVPYLNYQKVIKIKVQTFFCLTFSRLQLLRKLIPTQKFFVIPEKESKEIQMQLKLVLVYI